MGNFVKGMVFQNLRKKLVAENCSQEGVKSIFWEDKWLCEGRPESKNHLVDTDSGRAGL